MSREWGAGMGGFGVSVVRAAVAGVLVLSIAACGSSAKEAATTTSSSTTSTTIALALPGDQVEVAARGLLSIADIGQSWRDLGDPGLMLPRQTGYPCGAPNLAALSPNAKTMRSVRFRSKQDGAQLSVDTFVFADPSSASVALARVNASYSCGSWVDPEEGVRYDFTQIPNPPVDGADEIATWKILQADTTFYTAILRVGAQIFDFTLFSILPIASDTPLCQGGSREEIQRLAATASGEQLQFVICLANGLTKQRGELRKYTKEYYATLATSTTTGKRTTSTTKAK
jgi:hypothetical protein